MGKKVFKLKNDVNFIKKEKNTRNMQDRKIKQAIF